MKILGLEKCPEGQTTGTCKKTDCILQEGKWKGVDIPEITLEQNANDNFAVTCLDYCEE